MKHKPHIMTFAMLALTGTYVATIVAKQVGSQENLEIFIQSHRQV
jgi:hypothetical protein